MAAFEFLKIDDFINYKNPLFVKNTLKKVDPQDFQEIFIKTYDFLDITQVKTTHLSTETQKWHYIIFFENRIAKWISNLLSLDRIYYLEIQFTKSRSNLLSRDRNLLNRDRIYYLEIEFAKSRSNLLSRDQIYYLKIEIE